MVFSAMLKYRMKYITEIYFTGLRSRQSRTGKRHNGNTIFERGSLRIFSTKRKAFSLLKSVDIDRVLEYLFFTICTHG